MRGRWFKSANPQRDFDEDDMLENGGYLCSCWRCNKEFKGHKRRTECKLCGEELDKIKESEFQAGLRSVEMAMKSEQERK